MRNLAIVLVPLLILALVIGGIGCGGDEGEGKLPTWNTGDSWVLRMMSEGIEVTTTVEVVGEDVTDGKNCYVMEVSSEPPVMGIISSASVKIDKATMRSVRMQMSGEFMGYPFVQAISWSYFPDETPYPLEVGKELEVIATETTTTIMGETQTETETNAYTLKVEGIEQITVPAGTFKCFKIVQYDEDGSAFETEWHSDTTKWIVKTIEHETEELTELVSYSLTLTGTPTPTPTPTATSTPTSTATPVAGFLTYNDVVNGFSISYPEDWDLMEDFMAAAVWLAGPILEDGYMVNVSIVVEEIPELFSASDYARVSALRIQKEHEGFQKVEEYETTVDGYDAIVMVIDATAYGTELREKVAFVVKDGMGYFILYDISRDYHDQYVYVFDEVIRTFKFQ